MAIKGRRWLWSLGAVVGIVAVLPFAGCGSNDATTDTTPEAGVGGDDATTPDSGSAVCGNKIVEKGEDCDDGNKQPGDGCENGCTFTCTKGGVNGDPRCDDKEPCNGAETCTDAHTCAPGTPLGDHASCGSGKICRSSVCSDAVCGDGVVTAPEECDDGNSVDGDGCDKDCKYSCESGDAGKSCGSANACIGAGTCGADHKCTPGTPAANGTACGAGNICANGVCGAAKCGDGVVTPPEACDDGNQTNGDGCENTCKFSCATPATDCPAPAVCNVASCSAAHICQTAADASKEGQTCGTNLVCKSGACVSPNAVCGNGTVDTGEDCDFGAGANTAGSGCEANCKFSCTVSPNSCDDKNPCNGVETCGANTVSGHAGQKCAAGTPVADGTACGTGNVCLAKACKASVCGDGYIDPNKGETCEPPNAGTCDANCHSAVCGNGTREPGEQCDDGNKTNLDGCDSTCKFEQNQRVNQLKMQWGTDTYCKLNALGAAIGSAAQSQIQTPLDDGVKAGTINVMFKFSGGDLAGTSGNVTMGSLGGDAVDADGGTYNGNVDNDWWYTVDPTSINGTRDAINTLTGTYTAKTLNAAGRFGLSISLSGSPAKLLLWNSTIRTAIGATTTPAVSTGKEPGHLASEHLDPALQSFASSGVGSGGAAAGQLCGNVSTGSLATVVVPTVLLSGVSNCVEAYAVTNSLLDVFIGGCHVLGGIIPVITATQPDQVDTTAPQGGAGAPYKLSASGTNHVVDTCKDKAGAVVPLATCFAATAYSSSFKFTTDRVIVK